MNFLAILVEFLGSFIFMFVIFVTLNPWAIGATLALLIAFGGAAISGGHFNPAVTIMALYSGVLAPDNAVGYIVAQVAGGLLAATVASTKSRN